MVGVAERLQEKLHVVVVLLVGNASVPSLSLLPRLLLVLPEGPCAVFSLMLSGIGCCCQCVRIARAACLTSLCAFYLNEDGEGTVLPTDPFLMYETAAATRPLFTTTPHESSMIKTVISTTRRLFKQNKMEDRLISVLFSLFEQQQHNRQVMNTKGTRYGKSSTSTAT